MSVQVVEARSTKDLLEICKGLDAEGYTIVSVVPVPVGFIVVAQVFEQTVIEVSVNEEDEPEQLESVYKQH